MGLKQFQRGMRHRLKYIQLRLRFRVRQLSRHRNVSKPVGPPSVAPSAWPCIEGDRSQAESDAINTSAGPTVHLPTLRQPVNRKRTQ
jgi:hypothetical protein